MQILDQKARKMNQKMLEIKHSNPNSAQNSNKKLRKMPLQEVRKFEQDSFSSSQHMHKQSSDSIMGDSSINYLGDKNYASSKESRNNLPPKAVTTYYN